MNPKFRKSKQFWRKEHFLMWQFIHTKIDKLQSYYVWVICVNCLTCVNDMLKAAIVKYFHRVFRYGIPLFYPWGLEIWWRYYGDKKRRQYYHSKSFNEADLSEKKVFSSFIHNSLLENCTWANTKSKQKF